jgi:diguanylate cyclase (GGDEF)-like protein/PAS domain S-box-containing protein
VWRGAAAGPGTASIPSRWAINWCGTMSDTIEIKVSERQLRWASLVFEKSTESLAVINAGGHIKAVNHSLASQAGYSVEDLIGLPIDLILDINQEGSTFSDWCASVKAHWSGPSHGLRRNGERYPAWLRLRCIDAGDPNRTETVLLLSLSEKLQLEPQGDWLVHEIERDALTGLWNRERLIGELERSIEKQAGKNESIVLIYIDLDCFKEINDVWGHHEGDRLLVQVASTLRKCADGDEILARMGGDEFSVLIQGTASLTRAEEVSRRFIHALAEPFFLGGECVYVTAGVGISEYPKDATDVAGLLICADQSMYQAKEEGRNQLQHFDAGPLRSIRRRRRLADALRGALERQQFSLVYQPIVDMKRKSVVKAEALIRWRCPEFPDVTPAEFIPLAEEMGLIASIGDWVFEEVLQFVLQLKAAGFSPIRISINKSASEFASLGSVAHWIDCLNDAQLSSDWIGIEITETTLLDGRAGVKNTIQEIRRSGFKLSLDDFGTGYSAMSYLLRFDLDYLKIDQSFIRNISSVRGQAIVEAMTVMSHKLGLQVIAEGVEAWDEVVFLRSISCDLVQGYFYSKPLAAHDFMSWCRSQGQCLLV